MRFLRHVLDFALFALLAAVIGNRAVQPKDLPQVIKRLKSWRAKNQLSRRQAAAVLQDYGCPVSASAIKSWEMGVQPPRELMQTSLEKTLKAHPTVVDPPRFGRWI
jgi:DNA-binding transcriptional regulator YiaG